MTIERLGYEDARILRLESDAIKGHLCDVSIVEPAPSGEAIDVDELRERIGARLGAEPRCRQRVAIAPRGLGRPVWADDPDFDLDRHVRAIPAERPIGPGELRERVGELLAERLDHHRPLWQLDAVGPLQGNRVALVHRIHHCMTDGIGSIRLSDAILWDREPEAARPEPERWQPQPAPGAPALLADELSAGARRVAGGIGSVARAMSDRRGLADAAREAARLPGALAREMRPTASERTAFDRIIGPRRAVAWVRRPLAELKGIGSEALGEGGHATVNDVLLAAIAGGVRSWVGADGAGESMRVKVPVSMHARDHDSAGIANRDSFLFIDLPIGEPDPVGRLRAINGETVERKRAGDAEELYVFFHGLSHLSPLHDRVVRRSMSPRQFTLSVSNVPGPREPRYVLGARVAELYKLPEPAARHAMRISAVSLAGDISVGLNTDPDAMGDPASLAGAIDDAFEELAEAA